MIMKNKSSIDVIWVRIIYYEYLSRWKTLAIKSQLLDFYYTSKVYCFDHRIGKRTPIELILEPSDSFF